MKKTFDYEDFANDMEQQAKGLIPQDLDKEAEEFLLENLKKFTLFSGEALVNDESSDMTDEQITFICQIIAEWTFHKTVDLAHSEIPTEFWEPILQKIAYVIFEYAKENIDLYLQPEYLEEIETKVQETYEDSISKMQEKGIISKEIGTKAKKLSNIDSMSEGMKHKNSNRIKNKLKLFLQFKNFIKKEQDKDLYKHPALIISLLILTIIIIIVLNILGYINHTHKLSYTDIASTGLVIIVCLSILIDCHLKGIKLKKYETELTQTQKDLTNLTDPNRMYERFGTDVLSIQVGTNLIDIADPDLEGELLPRIAALRQDLTDELGYVIPNVRVLDSCSLEPNEYRIFVRGWCAGTGFVYPEKYMVTADEWDKHYDEIPEDAIVGVDPVYQTQVYWISEKDFREKTSKYNIGIEPLDIIIKHLKECSLENVNYILEKRNVIKLSELVRSQDPTLVNDLMPELISATDIRKIFVNLIREKVSIKDIILIFERLNDYARYTKNANILSEKLRIDLKHNIVQNCVGEELVLYAITLPEKWENLLNDNLKQHGEECTFELAPEVIQQFVEETAQTLLKATQAYAITEHKPVILASAKIRLSLFRLLKNYLDDVTVMTYSELPKEIKVEELFKIGE